MRARLEAEVSNRKDGGGGGTRFSISEWQLSVPSNTFLSLRGLKKQRLTLPSPKTGVKEIRRS